PEGSAAGRGPRRHGSDGGRGLQRGGRRECVRLRDSARWGWFHVKRCRSRRGPMRRQPGAPALLRVEIEARPIWTAAVHRGADPRWLSALSVAVALFAFWPSLSGRGALVR